MPIKISTVLPEASRKSPQNGRETVSEGHEWGRKSVSEIGRNLPEINSEVVYCHPDNAESVDAAETYSTKRPQVAEETRVLHFGNVSYLAADAPHIGISVVSRSYNLFWSRNEIRGGEVCHG